MRVERALLLAAILCIARNSPAQQTDIKGSQDHPLIPRYAGSSIIGYDTREFDELTLALGKSVAGREATGFAFKFSKSQRVEGKLTRLLYVAPEGRSSLEVFRNYETALKKAGFQPLFACAATDCDLIGNAEPFQAWSYGQAKRFENGTPSSAWLSAAPRNALPGGEAVGSRQGRLRVADGRDRDLRSLQGHLQPSARPPGNRRNETHGGEHGDGRRRHHGEGHRQHRPRGPLRDLLRYRQRRDQAGVGSRRWPRSASS